MEQKRQLGGQRLGNNIGDEVALGRRSDLGHEGEEEEFWRVITQSVVYK